MKRSLVFACIGTLLFGCADKEAFDKYYAIEQQRTAAIIASIERQSAENSKQRAQEMQFFSNAASNAARTENQTDDTLVAFAWGYRMGQPQRVEIPKLNPIKAPDSSADLVRAWTPIVGMAVPFLYPLAYGWSNGGGNSYTATDNAKINFSSENSGSLNTAGNDQTIQNTDQRIQLEDDCIDCDGAGSGLTYGADEASIDPVPVCPGTDVPAIQGPDGTYWIDYAGGCSCESRSSGRC